jgi:hypothetical protein
MPNLRLDNKRNKLTAPVHIDGWHKSIRQHEVIEVRHKSVPSKRRFLL